LKHADFGECINNKLTESTAITMTMTENVLKLFGYRLWCLSNTGSDLEKAIASLVAGTVDGLFISRVRGFIGGNLDALTQVPNLRILGIGDAEGVDVSIVSRLRTLEFLEINTASGQVDFDELSNLKHLRVHVAKGRSFPNVFSPAMQALALWNLGANDLDLLKNFPLLTSLELVQARKIKTLDGIAHAKGLKFVSISYCPNLENIDAIGALSSVEFLELDGVKKIHGYGAIKNLKMLSKLIIMQAGPVCDLGFLAQLKKLKSVVLRKVSIKNHDLSPLTNLPLLTHISLDSKKGYQPVLSVLEKLVESRRTLTTEESSLRLPIFEK
jgi:hypothetical protein